LSENLPGANAGNLQVGQIGLQSFAQDCGTVFTAI
jgi:hypothetical protein